MTQEPQFIWNGVSSLRYHIRLLEGLDYTVPEEVLQFEEIAGRQGAIPYSEERMRDIHKQIPIEIEKQADQTLPQQLRQIIRWLRTPRGYTKLILSTNPNYYYEAICHGGFQTTNETASWVDTSLPFRCKPVMYRLDGDLSRAVTDGQVLTNPESEPALPIITFRFSGTADGTLTVNGRQYRFARTIGAGLITLDSEKGIAYREGQVNISNQVFVQTDGYRPPVLEPGDNTIRFTTQLTNVQITPRWRAIAL
ncbi:distal tail protein Dit [Enterococcus sp. OL5]|uniref:distal tail protein Dit n=1 Tax=Enterococcus sp. OL5 TaxID=2590214 RepID=UPI00112BCB4E|nr:distal tail protein Dit [Enterococcus sp. OL5]TPR55405.1 phage tail protein [Enterococcus sp. OL5]